MASLASTLIASNLKDLIVIYKQQKKSFDQSRQGFKCFNRVEWKDLWLYQIGITLHLHHSIVARFDLELKQKEHCMRGLSHAKSIGKSTKHLGF